jgi:adenylate cyclase class IV
MAAGIEVELKLKIERAQVPAIEKRLVKLGFIRIPTLLTDTDLRRLEPDVSRRVRKEVNELSGATNYYLTSKRKLKKANGANQEEEISISKEHYDHLLSTEKQTFFGIPVEITKRRVRYERVRNGKKVTVCIDDASGPPTTGIDLGWFAEIETIVNSQSEIKNANLRLRALKRKLLPQSGKRERRGYRSMLRSIFRDVLLLNCYFFVLKRFPPKTS